MADLAVIPATVLTYPYCAWSSAAELPLRRLQFEFGGSVPFTSVVVGL